jgi:hypothetical protein
MPRLLEFPLKDSLALVTVEVEDELRMAGEERAGRGGRVVERAKQTFEEALETVKPVIAAVAAKFQDAASTVGEVSVEFGVRMSGETGIVLTKVGVEANFKVSLTWKK